MGSVICVAFSFFYMHMFLEYTSILQSNCEDDDHDIAQYQV